MSIKLTYDYVKTYIESFNYKLLSKTYKNAHTKLNIQCDKNHIYKGRWNNFKKGARCPECRKIVLSKKFGFSFNKVKEYIESFNYKLLSKTYKNAHTKLNIQCDKNHIYNVTYNKFQQGKRCPICNGGIKLTYNYVKTYIESFNYKLLSKTYTNNNSNLKVQCDKKHVYYVKYYNFQQGKRCPICWNESTSSKAEIEIQNYISKNFPIRFIKNDRNTILNPNTGYYLELDIYLPDLNKAIEYNGTYWHSLSSKIKNDKIKQNECKKLDIDLLIIKECDFTKNKEYELNKIKGFVNERCYFER